MLEGWYTESGKYVDWGRNDHCAVLIGYTPDTVTIADPIAGEIVYSRKAFEKVFALLKWKKIIPLVISAVYGVMAAILFGYLRFGLMGSLFIIVASVVCIILGKSTEESYIDSDESIDSFGDYSKERKEYFAGQDNRNPFDDMQGAGSGPSGLAVVPSPFQSGY